MKVWKKIYEAKTHFVLKYYLTTERVNVPLVVLFFFFCVCVCVTNRRASFIEVLNFFGTDQSVKAGAPSRRSGHLPECVSKCVQTSLFLKPTQTYLLKILFLSPHNSCAAGWQHYIVRSRNSRGRKEVGEPFSPALSAQMLFAGNCWCSVIVVRFWSRSRSPSSWQCSCEGWRHFVVNCSMFLTIIVKKLKY